MKKIFVISTYSTIEHSASFWMSTLNGGSGQGDAFLEIIQQNNPGVARELWEEVVAADGGGAAIAFLWIANSGIWLAPPAWPALVASVGFAAAGSSMFTYIMGIS